MNVITKRTFQYLLPILFALMVIVVTKQSAWSQAITTKLNPPVTALSGYVTYAEWSPDGSFVVYSEEIEDQTEDNCLFCSYKPGRLYLQFINQDSPLLISNNLNEVINRGTPENHGFSVTNDSKYIVYATSDGELYSIPIDTLQPITITSGINTWQKFQVLRSENRVLALQSVEEAQHIVSFMVTGGDPLMVSTELPELSKVVDFFVSPDESRVVYLIDQEEHERSALYSVELKNGHTTKLQFPRSMYDKVLKLGMMPDSEHLIITTGKDKQSQLFSISLHDGSAINLTPVSTGTWTEIKYFTWSLDSKYIIYIADPELDSRDEIYSVPVGGGDSIKLNANLPEGGDVVNNYKGHNISISADNMVIYQADQQIDDQFELFSVPITGGTPKKLNGQLIANGDVDYFMMTPDRLSVVYVADQEQDGFSEIYNTTVDGTSSRKLNRIVANAPIPNGDVYSMTIDQANSLILFQSGDDLFKISTTDMGVTQINPTSLQLDHDWLRNKWWLNPDATQLLYLAHNKEQDSLRNELYAFSVNGGESKKVNAPLAIGGDVWEYYLSPDGSRLVFQGNVERFRGLDAYGISLADGKAVKLNNSYIGLNAHLQFSEHGKHIAYIDSMHELWSVDLDLAGASAYSPTKLSDYYTFDWFVITPDSTSVVFEKWINPYSANSYGQYYRIPISGGTPFPIGNSTSDVGVRASDEENALLFPLNGNRDNVIKKESSTNVDQSGYCSWQLDLRATHDNKYVLVKGAWLSKIPLDGTPFIRLYSGPDSSVGVTQFAESDDGKFIVFRKGCDVESANDLFSIPYTGGEPIKLNATRPISGNVADFQISNDSAYVIYKVDQDIYQAFDLYSIPITGGVPIKLNTPLINGGTILDFALTPDSKTVIFRAEQEVDNVAELYQVPLAGGVPSKLNLPLVSNGNVKQFFVTGNQWVVYLADQEMDERFELYSASLTNGTVIKLSGNLQPAGNIVDVAVSPDGTFVIYRADQEQDEVYELYHVPLAGGTITKLNSQLVSGGDVKEFTISANNTHVVYRADQETDDVVELYASSIAAHTLFLPVVYK
ncbi:MAG: hypothetical protein U0175_27955 [Caldilineaceae bacterium]